VLGVGALFSTPYMIVGEACALRSLVWVCNVDLIAGHHFEVLLLGMQYSKPLPCDWFLELNLPGTTCYLVLLVCGFYTALTWSIHFSGLSFWFVSHNTFL
jgi:hypothetical protein